MNETAPPSTPLRRYVARVAAFALALPLFVAGATWVSARGLERNVVHATPTTVSKAEEGAFEARRDLRIDRMEILTIHEGRLYGMEDHFLYVSDDFGETFKQKGALPPSAPAFRAHARDGLARHPLVRSLRNIPAPDNLAVLSSGTILVFYDRIYRSVDGGRSFDALDTPVDGLHGPMPNGVAVGPDDRVAFGEYVAGERPQVIRVAMGTDDGREWKVCHTFEEGTVYHVHSVTYDPFVDRFLVATGDRDEESGLWELDPDCDGVERVGGGAQKWRLLAPIYTEAFVLWGSDDDRDGADVWLKPRGRTEPVRIHPLGKPSYFSTTLADGTLVVTTAYEPDSPFTREHDPHPSAEIWISRDGSDWFLLDRLPWVERQHPWGRSRARARPPAGDSSSRHLLITPGSTEDGFVTYRYTIDWDDEPPALRPLPGEG